MKKGTDMKVFVMRGLPGSGKSTWIERVRKDFGQGGSAVVSADHHHVKGGVYRFDPSKIRMAHDACLGSFLSAVREGKLAALFVDNTNVSVWELAPYVRLAELFNHEVEIIRIECDPLVAAKRNVHGVPAATVFRMWDALRSERLPGHWKETVELAVT